jgi:hypothetical protein
VLAGAGEHREVAVTGAFVKSDDGALPPRCVTPFVVTEEWGYAPVGPKGDPELFDLGSDRLAERDISEGNEAAVAAMRDLLQEHLREHKADDWLINLW